MASHMEENMLGKDFKILLSLGCGSFGEVKLACHLPTCARVAVKVLEKNINNVTDIASEVELLQSLEHRNIVRFFHKIDTLTTTYVIMEYVAGADLERCLRALGCLTEEEAIPIFQQVVSAVQFLHQRHIAHRDIKLENILIDAAGNVKLCDFGMAIKVTEGQMLEEICGSLLYWAPEILARKPYNGLAADMWSLGIVLYVLVTGNFPYVEATTEDMYRTITTAMCPIPFHLSKQCHGIIAKLLMVPTWYRMTIHELVERPWLGHIQEHGLVATKEVLPRIVDTMCTIGYTCEEIVSSLTNRQLKGEVMATFNILKYQLSGGDSHQQVEKPWASSKPAAALSLLPPLKRRASEPVFSTCLEAGKSHLQDEGVEGRGKSCRGYPTLPKYSCMEKMPCSDDPVPEDDALTADITNTATGDIAADRNSTDSLPTATGDIAAYRNSTDSLPTATGDIAADINSMDSLPTATGDIAADINSTDSLPTATGDIAADTNSTDSLPTATGDIAADRNSTDSLPTATGDIAADRNSSDSLPTATGDIAADRNSTDSLPTATGDIAVDRNSTDSLPSEHISPVSAQDEPSTGFVNMGFCEEEPSTQPEISNDQSHGRRTASGSRLLRALKALCCCCCLPCPRWGN